MTQREELHGPPMYFTPDWEAAARSVRLLATLNPLVAATGHGIPLRGPSMRSGLQALARSFEKRAVPRHGVYVDNPAIMDEDGGVTSPTPPVPDPAGRRDRRGAGRPGRVDVEAVAGVSVRRR